MGSRMSGVPELKSHAADEPLTILIPIFNDWAALEMLLELLDRALAEHGLSAGVLVVDDGSTLSAPARDRVDPTFRALRQVEVLELRRNLGTQRALAIGITFVEDRGHCDELVVMDGDGEDDPRDVPRLVMRSREEGGERIVFAERTKRSESALFRVFYVLYKVLHGILTGYGVRVGNFSVIPLRPAPEPGRRLRDVEPLCGGGVPFTTADQHDPDSSRSEVTRPVTDELLQPGDPWLERHLGL